MPKDKKALFVSYHFPPINTAGVARITGFIKYLRQSGWGITVITVKGSPRERSDPGMLEHIPDGVRVVRTGSLEIDALTAKRRHRAAPSSLGGAPHNVHAQNSPIVSLLKAPLRAVYRLLTFPDKQVGWMWHLFVTCLKTIKEEDHYLVFSSSPPHSSQMAIAMAKRLRRFTWVADFRDGWTAPAYRPIRNRFSRWLSQRLEIWVLKSCDKVIANTDGNRSALLSAFSFLHSDDVVVITNGFDTGIDIKPVEIAEGEDDCDFMYLGEIYAEVVDLLVSSLAGVRQRNGLLPRVLIYGHMDERDRAKIKQHAMEDAIVYRGSVGWAKSIHLMRRAKSLLLLLPHTLGGRTTVPSKLYSYMFADRPIMVVGPEGDATRIVKESGCGVAVTDRDPHRIAEALQTFLTSLEDGSYQPTRNERVLSTYTMEHIAEKVEGVLSGALER